MKRFFTTLLVLGASFSTPLLAQVVCHVDTCRTSCTGYDRLANYAASTSALIEVGVEAVIDKKEGFLVLFKVYDVLHGEFSDSTFRVYLSSGIAAKYRYIAE